MKLLDYVAILLSLAVTGIVAASAYGTQVTNPVARIRAAGITLLYPLDVDREIAPLADPASCRIVIDSKGIRVVSSDCPQQICVSMGAISFSGQWIACLPHNVLIDIVAGPDSPVDAQTY